MTFKKVLVVVGTRPEAIKIAPVIYALKNFREKCEIKIFSTGQHGEMLDQVFHAFDYQPDWSLNTIKNSKGLHQLTANILLGTHDVLNKYQPDVVLVHGDTVTTLAASLSAFYSNIPIAHVEAGLRTQNLKSPFPEEFNRFTVDKISSYHYAPTETCKKNLISEGINKQSILVTGNTVVDSIKLIKTKINKDISLQNDISDYFNNILGFDLRGQQYILVTVHRRENLSSGMWNIFKAIKRISETYPDLKIVCPLHSNPIIKEAAYATFKNIPNIYIISPQAYPNFIFLAMNCYAIVSDSGGLQEEAPSLRKPLLITRNTTERPEGVEAGVIKLIGTEFESIVCGMQEILDDNQLYRSMISSINPFGDGASSMRIVSHLLGDADVKV